MKYFDWNEEKNQWLKKERNISFEMIVSYLEEEKMLAKIEHPNKEKYPDQFIFIIEHDNYAYLVTFVEDQEKVFLKTIIPSRSATKSILGKDKMDKYPEYEKDILESYENGEWQSSDDIEKERKKYTQIARNTILKNKRINIRISERDLTKLKSRSVEEGLPYQTLISSVLHKYISGKLIEQH